MIDLNKKKASDILNDKILLDAFKKQYEDVFGYLPDCVPCKIKSNLSKLKRAMNSKNKVMSKNKKEYKLKRSYLSKILTYKEKGKRTVHFFGRNLTDDLAKKFIDFGVNPKTEKERKELFEVLPIEKPKVEEKKPKVEEKKPKVDKKAK